MLGVTMDRDAALQLLPPERTGGNLYWSSVTSVSIRANKACRCCGLSYSGGVPRIKMYLLRRAVCTDLRQCTFVNAEESIQSEFIAIKAEAQRRFIEENATRSRTAQRVYEEAVADVTASALVSGGGSSSLATIDLTQPTIAHAFQAQTGKIPTVGEVDAQWSKALVATGTPFFHVENAEFRKAVLMTHRLAGATSDLTTPPRSYSPDLHTA
jgi:hypothetical protein